MKAGRAAASSATALSSITLQWIRSNMPRTRRVLSDLPDLGDVRLAASIHFEPKMLVLVEGLRRRGAEVFLAPCNVDTARRSFVDGALGMGCTVFGGSGGDVGGGGGAAGAGAAAAAAEALLWRPTHTLEMGADLTALAHRSGAGADASDRGTIRAAVECTRSGLSRLGGLDLGYPVFDADSIPVKEGLHNRFMVGLTTWSAFLSCTALSLHEKTVSVVGFGAVGEGLASSAHHFGAAVRVVDVDPARRVAASFRGWDVADLDEAAATSDVIVTATGRPGVLSGRHFDGMRDGTVLINVGHRPDEIDVASLASRSEGWTDPAPHLREYVVDAASERGGGGGGGGAGPASRRIRLFAGGSMANLVAGVGDSVNAFDTTLAVIAAALGYALDDARSSGHRPGLHPVPRCVWSAALE